MPAQNLPGLQGPYRIDVVPQNPTFAALPDYPKPHTAAANSPHTLVGDTSSIPAVEVQEGWAFARPAESPAFIDEP
jgi:hypothetical protein